MSFEYVDSSEKEESNSASNQEFKDRMEASGKQNKSLIPRTLSRSSTGQRIPPSLVSEEIVNTSPFRRGGHKTDSCGEQADLQCEIEDSCACIEAHWQAQMREFEHSQVGPVPNHDECQTGEELGTRAEETLDGEITCLRRPRA